MSLVRERIERWIHQSADQRCKCYIFFTTVGSFIARAVQFGRLPFFSDKYNFLNQVSKYGKRNIHKKISDMGRGSAICINMIIWLNIKISLPKLAMKT